MIGILESEIFTHKFDSAVREYNVYKDIWEPFQGELLPTKQEIGNLMDKRAVSLHFCT